MLLIEVATIYQSYWYKNSRCSTLSSRNIWAFLTPQMAKNGPSAGCTACAQAGNMDLISANFSINLNRNKSNGYTYQCWTRLHQVRVLAFRVRIFCAGTESQYSSPSIRARVFESEYSSPSIRVTVQI